MDLYWTYATNDCHHYQKIQFLLLHLLMRLSDLFYLWKEILSVSSVWHSFEQFSQLTKSPVWSHITLPMCWDGHVYTQLVVDIFIKINSSDNWFPDLSNFWGQLQILHFDANYCTFQLPFHLKLKCTDWMAKIIQLRCLKITAVFTFQMSSQLAA